MFEVISREVEQIDDKIVTTKYNLKNTEINMVLSFDPQQAHALVGLDRLINCRAIVDSNGNKDIELTDKFKFDSNNNVVRVK